ncbi:uncharacterized protein PAC_12038 [Phialocephala subalpina]|uniref:Uncharacterized protein n=1 Tax=Phialocephala subalpina TaxID=576137 RepID=A0A1L7XAT9_9HELO|nr:uncharacterized protein PAC_12038 [Phialocephala subalpina]
MHQSHASLAQNFSAETLLSQTSHRRALSAFSNEKLIQLSSVELPMHPSSPPLLGLFSRYSIFTPLIPTTIISSFLLAGSVRHWTVSKALYDVIVVNRASTQLVVQVIANSLGLLHVTVLCMLINYSTRLRLASTPTSLDVLQLWTGILSRQLDWTLPLHFLALLLIFVAICIVPGAVWAAAITPIVTTKLQLGSTFLPAYSNLTLLQQNYTNRLDLPSIANSKGVFAYNVGETYLGSLLYSASTATTIDGSVRDHAKFDHSRFTYHGRSYGIGASVGLLDDNLLSDTLATQYVFQERGYAPLVTCIYNASSAFALGNDTVDPENMYMYAAQGYLPNSEGRNEWSRYPGFSTNATVAIGVATIPDAVGRILGIASGNMYPNLNNTQCSIDFQPTLFNVTVNINNHNITVTPVDNSTGMTDIEPTGFLTFLATWQFTLVSTDQTSFYSSLVGNSFNASVANYVTSISNTSATAPNATQATLVGLTNSVSAMVDDILVSYASAQIMVANDTRTASSSITMIALQIGEGQYIIAIAIFNALLFLVVVEEAIRTRVWKTLTDFNYMNPRNLILGSSRGGGQLAEVVDTVIAEQEDGVPDWGQTTSHGVGNVRIVQHGSRIILASES